MVTVPTYIEGIKSLMSLQRVATPQGKISGAEGKVLDGNGKLRYSGLRAGLNLN